MKKIMATANQGIMKLINLIMSEERMLMKATTVEIMLSMATDFPVAPVFCKMAKIIAQMKMKGKTKSNVCSRLKSRIVAML